MKQVIGLCVLASSLASSVGCAIDEAGQPGDDLGAVATTSSALTTGDVDVPPECQGILGYTNAASLQELDAFLPYSVANSIVVRRASAPFISLADVSSISGIAQARLASIAAHARSAGWIDASCAGVYEELGVSADDVTAILSYANTASSAELTQVVRFEPENTVPQLIARRPFTDVQTLVDTYGVGPDTFRSIRDAAIDTPFDLLVDSVNAAHRNAALSTAFDWYDIVVNMPGRPTGLACFGVDPGLIASLGGQLLPDLATGDEVVARVTSTVNYANRYGQVTGIAAGLADLTALTAGQSFFGCYLSFEPDPWSGVTRAFFVNTQTGYRVLAETSWSE